MREKYYNVFDWFFSRFTLEGICLGMITGLLLALTVASAPRGNKFERAQRKVVLVETDAGYGSAVAFRRGEHTFLLTAKHCVDNRIGLQVNFYHRVHGIKTGISKFPARVLLISGSADLAVLEVDLPDGFVDSARVSHQLRARVGEKIIAVGNFHGPDFDGTVTEGIISQVGTKPERITDFPWATVDQGTAQNSQGSSGGGVFYESDGTLAGLTVGNLNDQSYAHLPIWLIRATAQREGWGWVLGDGKMPDPVQIAVMEALQAPKPVEKKPEVILDIGGLLRGLLPLGTPDPVNPHASPVVPADPHKPAPKKHSTPPLNGHRH